MKNSIKLKHSEMLEKLLRKPVELSIVILVAFHQDEQTGFAEKAVINPDKKALDNLILWGILTESRGRLSLVDKKIVDITLKRSSKQKRELDVMILTEVDELKVPSDEIKYYKTALAFHQMFYQNVKDIGGYLEHLNKAKYKKWVDPVRLMMQNDNITIEQLREVFKFLTGHSFWSSNVQSTEKLRDKFSTIYSQVKGYGKKDNGTGQNGSGATVSEGYVRGVIDELQSE